MKSLIRNWITIAIVLAMLVTSLLGSLSSAQTNEAQSASTALGFEAKFRNINYTVENLDVVITDLEAVKAAADNGASVKVVAEVSARMMGAIDLMAAIMVDPNQTEDQKSEKIFKLADAIGQIFIAAALEEHELDKEIKKLTTVQRAGLVLQRMLYDVKSVFPLRKSAGITGVTEPGRVFGLADRFRRVGLTRELTTKMQSYATQVLTQFASDSPLRQYTRDFWRDDVVNKVINMQKTRRVTQASVGAVLLGLAFYASQAPHLDLFSLVNARGENTLFFSSMVYTGTWITLALVKVKSILTSTKTIAMLQDLSKMLDNPEQFKDAVLARMQVKGKGALDRIKSWSPRSEFKRCGGGAY